MDARRVRRAQERFERSDRSIGSITPPGQRKMRPVAPPRDLPFNPAVMMEMVKNLGAEERPEVFSAIV